MIFIFKQLYLVIQRVFLSRMVLFCNYKKSEQEQKALTIFDYRLIVQENKEMTHVINIYLQV